VTIVLALVLGLVAGVFAGMFGVGGGILFVPTLVALGLSQHDATGTSLLAIIPTAVAGTWRQQRYGNVGCGRAGRSRARGGVARSHAASPLRRTARHRRGSNRLAST
jgi:hypothetical protein